ncbi:alpha/beta-type small acid-soluble spore protein [Sporosarcina sp. ANT_H38]|uniref:alpha/beta-type small acid-soluble spore protein n=1 Tax=Sporosarcina sp. ANT_H38 TaxID=2597358 RepID=UPI0011F0B1CC|nr:alpha/beta-type small acid-soluble spore protein [Sporosarcina sp. ANT_H38]KAA0965140.1 alpha/beta-type small acid-soluble spore protein [Sporosarcina sp. ANT_H38]
MPNNNSGNSNKLVVPGVRQALDQMKNEIASEFGVQMGPDAASRANGSVGGEITKRLVRQAQQQMNGNK